MGKPITDIPDEVTYTVEAWFPELSLWSPIVSFDTTGNEPSPARIKRELEHINGMRAKGSPKITRLRTLKRLTFIGVEYTEKAL